MTQPIIRGLLAGLLAALASVPAAAQVTQNTAPKPAVEPRDIAGITAAINDVRGRLNLPKLAWSAELAAKADATARAAAGGACSLTTAEKAAIARDAAVYWAAAVRRLGGEDAAQSLSPGYVVATWREGRRELESGRGQCRTKSGACDAYARMTAPTARLVGCARTICPNKAQIWACHYSG